jgi:arylsulfatase A-like enzyme
LLFIIESYGYTAYSKPELFNRLEPFFLEREVSLRKNGYHIFSHFIGSPVIGGWSWLADATLLTGIRIDSQQKYKALLQSNAPSLPKLFQEAGYNTLLAAPGTVHGSWEEVRLFYGFDEDMLGSDYVYNGPGFSFVPITDQRLKKDEITACFVEYILVSSHGPFNRIPPYIENWEELGDGSIYNDLPMQYFDNDWYTGREYDEGYEAAIRYVLKVITEYLVQFIDDETLVVIVGDHQPKFPITERGSPLSVPVHVISRDRSLIELLVGHGYVESLIPSQSPPHPGMETFYQTFMDVINGSSP